MVKSARSGVCGRKACCSSATEGKIQVGLSVLACTSAMVASPLSTRAVSTPARRPQAMSVYRRSPTTRASSGAQPAACRAYCTMAGSGLPRNLGRRWVAVSIMLQMAPQSGR